ncbi:MAG TPA: AmmeMemoRadiSam system protein A [Planctomycetota bacterium]|nr:AmmeMemoRadiSam system protein A [Planctomycetota bacterium]
MANELGPQARQRLLRIARASVEAAVRRTPSPPAHSDDPELQAQRGCFVTLTTAGRLRGCLGCFTTSRPLWKAVAEMARASATEDMRFFGAQLTPTDLPHLRIEISVLSPMTKIANPLDIELGVHGIYVVGKGGSGTYLPQVATEHHMSKEEFLSSCCAHKAGLPPDAWRTGEAEVFTYTAEVFGEEGSDTD